MTGIWILTNLDGGTMRNFGKMLLLSAVAAVLATVAPTLVRAQWDGGPVVVFDQQNGGGRNQSFNVGDYRNDRGQFGSLRNDSASSVAVANGYRVRLCEAEGSGSGGGRCEEYGPGNHNLRYQNVASYIRVTGPSGWGGGGGGNQGVTVYEDRDSRGRAEVYRVGKYLAGAGQFGNMKNDAASSVVVPRGYRVRLCENEGNDGRGSGRCEDHGEGRFNLRYDNKASFIEVTRSGGGFGNGGWGNGGGNNGGNNGGGNNNGGNNRPNNAVVVYADRNEGGTEQSFSPGTYRNDLKQFGRLKNDDAGSVYVPRGYRVRFCSGEGGGVGEGPCEEYGAGTYNLRYNDTASYIRVWRGN